MMAVLAEGRPSMRLDEITIGARYRADLGDIDALATNIREVGLLHSVVVTPDGRLIAGTRRIAAARLLGWDRIPVSVVDLDDLLLAEQSENTQRKDFTPSEAVAIGRAIQGRILEQARERQLAHLRNQPRSDQFTERGGRGDTRDIVGQAVGMSGPTYERAKSVVIANETDPETYGPFLEEMDRTGHVWPAYRKMMDQKKGGDWTPYGPGKPKPSVSITAAGARRAVMERMAHEGYRDDAIAEAVGVGVETVREYLNKAGVGSYAQRVGRFRRVDVNAVMESIVAYSSPSPDAVAVLDFGALDRGRLEEWEQELTQAIGTLTDLRNQLRRERGSAGGNGTDDQ